VAVGGTGVAVGGTGVAIGGAGVLVGLGVGGWVGVLADASVATSTLASVGLSVDVLSTVGVLLGGA